MKKHTILKKSLSVIMSAAVILSCLVFAAPVTADAADGDYFVRVTINVKTANNFTAAYGGFAAKVSDTVGVTVGYKGTNGTSSAVSYYNWDLGNGSTGNSYIKTTGEHTLTATVSGFPSILYCYMCDNHWVGSAATMQVTKMEVGSSETNYTTIWTGTMQVASMLNGYGTSVDMSGTEKTDYDKTGDNDNYISGSSGAWAGPIATNINLVYSKSALTLGTSDVTSSVTTSSATDQYGVKMITTPSYSSACSVSSTGIAFNTSSGFLTATSNARLSDSGKNIQTVTSTVSWPGGGGAGTKSVGITLTDPKYTATFNNASGAAMSTQSIYYGDTVSTPSSPDKDCDAQYHYTFSSWSPALTTPITQATTFNPQYTSEAHIWDEGVVTTEPTCTEAGIRTYTCTSCSATKTGPEAALGHDYVSSVTAPTCTAQGYTTHTCSRCGDSYVDTYVDALGHDYTSQVKSSATLRTAATCTADATYYYSCSRDGVIDKTDSHYFTDTGSALGHDFSSQIKSADTLRTAATCTTDATYYYTCSRDGVIDKTDSHYFIDKDSALGHNYSSNVTAPTCTEKGYTTYTCTRGDSTYISDYVEPLGHSYGEWVQTQAPTCTETGLQARTCARCSVIDTQPVPALGHDKQLQQVVPEDQSAGCIYYKCSRCNTYWLAQVDGETGELVSSDTPLTDLASVKSDTDQIPAPSFNTYYDTANDYDYSNRGAGLKLGDIVFRDENTIQDTRFTASLLVPEGVSYDFSSTKNAITDFGFIYSQTELLDYDIENFKAGKTDVYKLSVPARNSGTYDGSNWSGVTSRQVDGGTILTFNLLVGIRAKNWTKEYCARAYVTYNYQGFSYTVYDMDYSAKSVEYIAQAVVEDTGASEYEHNYCQSKILDNLSQME